MDGRVIIDRPVVRYVGPHGERHRFGLFRTKERQTTLNFSRLNMMPVTFTHRHTGEKKKKEMETMADNNRRGVCQREEVRMKTKQEKKEKEGGSKNANSHPDAAHGWIQETKEKQPHKKGANKIKERERKKKVVFNSGDSGFSLFLFY